MQPSVRARWVALAVVGFALLVLLPTLGLLLGRGFAGLYGQDAFGYVNYALGPLREALRNGQLPPAWPQPPGYPMVVAALTLATGPDARVALAVSLLAGATLPAATAWLAFETLRPRAGNSVGIGVILGAGLVAALPGQLWQSSAVTMPDTLAAVLAALGAAAVARYRRAGRGRWLVLAAAAVAGAIDTRWVYGLVAVPIGAVAFAGLWSAWRRDRVRAVGHGLAAAAVAGLVLGPMLGQMAVAAAGGRDIPFAADFGAYHWDPFNALRTTFDTTDGRLVQAQPSGLFYALQPFQPYWFGPPALLAIWGGAWVGRAVGAVATTLLVGWPLLVLAFLAGAPYQNTRFLLAAMPPLAILVATGAWRAVEWLEARLPAGDGGRRRAALAAGVTVLAVWVVVASLAATRFTDAFVARQAADLAAIRTLEAEVPPSARLIAMGPTGTFRFDGLPDVVELFDLDPRSASALLGDGRPSYLVIDPVAIQTQWAGRNPALTVAALREGRGLEAIATAGAWTLYRIGRALP